MKVLIASAIPLIYFGVLVALAGASGKDELLVILTILAAILLAGDIWWALREYQTEFVSLRDGVK